MVTTVAIQRIGPVRDDPASPHHAVKEDPLAEGQNQRPLVVKEDHLAEGQNQRPPVPRGELSAESPLPVAASPPLVAASPLLVVDHLVRESADPLVDMEDKLSL